MRRLLPLLLLAGLGFGLGGCAVYDRPAGYYRSGYAYNDGYRNQYGYRQYGYYRRDPYGW